MMRHRYLFVLMWLLVCLALPAVTAAQTERTPYKAEDIIKAIKEASETAEAQSIRLDNAIIRGVVNLTSDPADSNAPASVNQGPPRPTMLNVSLEIINSEFTDNFIASGVTFNQPVLLNGTTFSGRMTTFDSATFEQTVSFNDVTFKNSVNFFSARFKTDVQFNNASLAAANFNNASFAPITSFNQAIFSGYTNFIDSSFCAAVTRAVEPYCLTAREINVDFGAATFKGEVSFAGARFPCPLMVDASMSAGCPDEAQSPLPRNTESQANKKSDSKAEGGSQILRPEVKKPKFISAYFQGETSFNNARFYDVSFYGATFEGDTRFRLAEFHTVTFENAEFQWVDFNGITVSDTIKLIQTDYVSLEAADFDFARLHLSGAVAVDKRDMWKRLEDNFRTKNQLVLSHKALYERRQIERELEAENLTPQVDVVAWLQDLFERAAGDYVRPRTPLEANALLLIAGLLIYFPLALIGSITDEWRFRYFKNLGIVIRDGQAAQAGSTSSSVIIRLLSIKVPVRLGSTGPTPTQQAVGPGPDGQAAEDESAARTKSPGLETWWFIRAWNYGAGGLSWLFDKIWDGAKWSGRVFAFSLRVHNDSLGSNLEAVCGRRPFFIVMMVVAFCHRILGIALLAALTLTLTNVLPAVRSLFG